MPWYAPLLAVAGCVFMCAAWFRVGRQVQERSDRDAADAKVMEMTNGEEPAASVMVHIVNPTQIGVACEVYNEALSAKCEQEPTLVLRVAAVALAHAIEQMDGSEPDYDSAVADTMATGTGPYL